MTAIEMRRKRAELIERAGTILATARAAKRDVTTEEEREFDSLHAEAERLEQGIERQERQDESERQLAERSGNLRRLADTPEGRRAGKPTELGPDCVLGEHETFESRARDRVGEDDARFGALLASRCGATVSDLRESERRALSTSSGAGGGFTVPSVTSGRILDALVNGTQVIPAGAMRGELPDEGGEFLWPKLATRPTAAWVGENEQLSDASMTFEGLKVEPRILAVGPLRMPLKLVEQSAVRLERYAIDVMSREASIEVDRVAMFGLGTAKQPKGLIYWTGVNEKLMGANGAAITDYDPLLDAIKLIEDDNGRAPTAAIMAPRTSNTLAQLKTGISSDNTPLEKPDKIKGLPFLVTNQVPIDEVQGSASDASRILLGHWPDMTVFFQGPVRMLVLRERYADYLQVGVIVYVKCDVMVAYPESFASVTGIIP